MAIKRHPIDIRDMEFKIGDNTVSLSLKNGAMELLAFSNNSEGYYKIVVESDATMRFVGGNTQEKGMMLGKIQLKDFIYSHITATLDERATAIRTLAVARGMFSDIIDGCDVGLDIEISNDVFRDALRRDLDKISFLCGNMT